MNTDLAVIAIGGAWFAAWAWLTARHDAARLQAIIDNDLAATRLQVPLADLPCIELADPIRVPVDGDRITRADVRDATRRLASDHPAVDEWIRAGVRR